MLAFVPTSHHIYVLRIPQKKSALIFADHLRFVPKFDTTEHQLKENTCRPATLSQARGARFCAYNFEDVEIPY